MSGLHRPLLFSVAIATLLCVSQTHAQPGGPGGPRGFTPPPPPVVEAIDKNNYGIISAEELKNSQASLTALDENKDGEISGEELMPKFLRGGPGGFGGPGGGPGGGRGGFGGPGGGFGGGPGGGSGEKIDPEKLDFKDGVSEIPDEGMFHKLAYKGPEVMIDTFLADLEFVKFTLNDAASDQRSCISLIRKLIELTQCSVVLLGSRTDAAKSK